MTPHNTPHSSLEARTEDSKAGTGAEAGKAVEAAESLILAATPMLELAIGPYEPTLGKIYWAEYITSIS